MGNFCVSVFGLIDFALIGFLCTKNLVVPPEAELARFSAHCAHSALPQHLLVVVECVGARHARTAFAAVGAQT